MLKIKDLEAKSEKDLLNMVSELKGKLLALRFESATGQLTENHLIKETKRDIARIFTVLNSKDAAKPATKEVAKEAPKAVEAAPAEETVVEEAKEEVAE